MDGGFPGREWLRSEGVLDYPERDVRVDRLCAENGDVAEVWGVSIPVR